MYSHSSSFKQGAVPPKPVGLLERVREVARYKHYSIRTEQAYVEWIRRFVQFHGKRHPREMGAVEVRSFLFWLAGTRDIVASTHQQALSALRFLFRDVLELELLWLGEIERPKKPKRVPVVLSAEETGRLEIRSRLAAVRKNPKGYTPCLREGTSRTGRKTDEQDRRIAEDERFYAL